MKYVSMKGQKPQHKQGKRNEICILYWIVFETLLDHRIPAKGKLPTFVDLVGCWSPLILSSFFLAARQVEKIQHFTHLLADPNREAERGEVYLSQCFRHVSGTCSRWWFQTCLEFSPRNFGKMIQFEEHIFRWVETTSQWPASHYSWADNSQIL